jgi:hypothetical protein
MATEYRIWCESGDLIGYYRVNGAVVEDYSTGSHVEDRLLGHPSTADQWASLQANALLDKTIKDAVKRYGPGAGDAFFSQVVKDDD